MTDAYRAILMVIFGYLSGSMMFGYLLPKLFYDLDVRDFGDGNPGAYNAGLAVSKSMAVVCSLLDMLKAIVPVAIAFHVLHLRGWLLVPVVLAPLMGHLYPCTMHLSGGKGITAAFGCLIGLLPVHWLALLWAISILALLPFVRDHSRLIRRSLGVFSIGAIVLETTLPMRCIALLTAAFVASRHMEKAGSKAPAAEYASEREKDE